MSKPYLRRGSKNYYARLLVPKDLRPFVGFDDKWESLRVNDLSLAKRLERLRQVQWDQWIDEQYAERARLSVTPIQDVAPFQSEEHQAFMQSVWDDDIGAEDAHLERIDSDPVYREQHALADELREQRLGLKSRREDAEALALERRARSKAKPGTPLTTVVDQWATTQRNKKTVARMRALVRWFEDDFGKLPVEEITDDTAHEFRAKLLAKIKPTNARSKLAVFNTLLNSAVDQRIIKFNPAKAVKVIVHQEPEDRIIPFDLGALTSIFSAPIFTGSERPIGGRGEAAYWLPLLGLYTGARLNELGQLRPKDILEEIYVDADDGDADRKAWVINITGDRTEGLKLKNKSSKRRIPVHPELVRLGFLEFVSASQPPRLFPDLKPDTYGHITGPWSQWFGRLCDAVGVTNDRMVFHSFRHGFRQYGLQVHIHDTDLMALMGHTGPEIKARYNGPTPQLSMLVTAMNQFRIPGFQQPAVPWSMTPSR